MVEDRAVDKSLDLPQPKDINALTKLLGVYGVNIAYWGKGQAKSENDLMREIQAGDSRLILTPEGGLLREVDCVGVDVYHRDHDAGILYKLREDRQVFRDGRERKRTHLQNSLSEKRRTDELREQAAERALREELGIEGIVQPLLIRKEGQTREAQSYPGLISRYKVDVFSVFLKGEQYKPEGYIEDRDHLKSYFVWEKFAGTEPKEV